MNKKLMKQAVPFANEALTELRVVLAGFEPTLRDALMQTAEGFFGEARDRKVRGLVTRLKGCLMLRFCPTHNEVALWSDEQLTGIEAWLDAGADQADLPDVLRAYLEEMIRGTGRHAKASSVWVEPDWGSAELCGDENLLPAWSWKR